MQPIEEYGKGKGRKYGTNTKMNGTKYTDTTNIFYGRGYVQLTWYENYQKASKALGQDFIQHPELVMTPANASEIMFTGMSQGWFTGRKLGDYFNPTTEDWVNARRIINGLDKANTISGYAKQYYAAISHTV
jgi:putative chitinase